MKDTWGREVIVETQHYENFTGRYPYGRGNWVFHFGGYVYGDPLQINFSFSGTYSQARKEAVKGAAKNGFNLVVVCV